MKSLWRCRCSNQFQALTTCMQARNLRVTAAKDANATRPYCSFLQASSRLTPVQERGTFGRNLPTGSNGAGLVARDRRAVQVWTGLYGR